MKSPRVDNIPAELLNHSREEIVKALTTLKLRVWESEELPNECHTPPKER